MRLCIRPWVVLGRAKQNTTKQNKAQRSKTKHNEAKQSEAKNEIKPNHSKDKIIKMQSNLLCSRVLKILVETYKL